MTRPCRRMIRHLLQIRLTLGLTFTAYACLTIILGRLTTDSASLRPLATAFSGYL